MRVKRHYRLYLESKDFWEIFFITCFTERRNRKKVYVLWRITQIWIDKKLCWNNSPKTKKNVSIQILKKFFFLIHIKLVQWLYVTRLSQKYENSGNATATSQLHDRWPSLPQCTLLPSVTYSEGVYMFKSRWYDYFVRFLTHVVFIRWRMEFYYDISTVTVISQSVGQNTD